MHMHPAAVPSTQLSPPASAPPSKRPSRLSGLLGKKDPLNAASSRSRVPEQKRPISPALSPTPSMPLSGASSNSFDLPPNLSTGRLTLSPSADNSTVASSSSASLSSRSRSQSHLAAYASERRPSTGLTSPAPVSGVQSVLDVHDEPECPVCLEALSLRLKGERQHIVPNCGHAMHHDCFSALYGDPKLVHAAQERKDRAGLLRKSSTPAENDDLVCQVCRKHIVLGGCDKMAVSKSAALMGSVLPSARTSLSSDASSSRMMTADSNGDDKAEPVKMSTSIVQPEISVVSDFSPIYRREPGHDGLQRLNVLLTISLPGRRPQHEYGPGPGRTLQRKSSGGLQGRPLSTASTATSATLGRRPSRTPPAPSIHASPSPEPASSDDPSKKLYALAEEESDTPRETNRVSQDESRSSRQESRVPLEESKDLLTGEALRDQVKMNLDQRIVDWKGHHLEHFGELHYHDTLDVFQDTTMRQFGVYLFEEALLCTMEDRRKHVSRYLSIPHSLIDESSPTPPPSTRAPSALKLKGRIYLRHIRSVVNTSTADEAALSIKMIDDTLSDFIVILHSEQQACLWQRRMEQLIHNLQKPGDKVFLPRDHDLTGSTEEVTSVPTPAPASLQEDEITSPTGSPSRFSRLSRTSSGGRSSCLSTPRPLPSPSPQSALPPIPSSRPTDPMERYAFPPELPIETPTLFAHAAIDLVFVVAIPIKAEGPDVLKLGMLRSTLVFLLDAVGDKSRVSFVAYHPGLRAEGSFVAKTRLLRPSLPQSRDTLVNFLDSLATGSAAAMGGYVQDLTQLGGAHERTDTAAALNVGLDVMLQRTTRNPLASIFLIDDCATGPRRTAMDLVLSRGGMASCPVHCFGLGPGHDPSSLWLIASHTKGSYTFLRRTSELRTSLAGCVGSLLSTGLTEAMLRIQLMGPFLARKPKHSSTTHLVDEDGRFIEVPLGPLAYGQKRDVLLELSFDFDEVYRDVHQQVPLPEGDLNGADAYLTQFGFDPALLDTPNLGVTLLEDVQILTADLSYRDPQALLSTRISAEFSTEIDGSKRDPLVGLSAAQVAARAHPAVTQRTMETLTSSLVTNCLLVAQRDLGQAFNLLQSNRRMIESVLHALPGHAPRVHSPSLRSRRSPTPAASPRGGGSSSGPSGPSGASRTADSLHAILEDLDTLLAVLGAEVRRPTGRFEREGRKFAAQQAMVLRSQRAWSSRSNSEHLHFRDENGPALAALSLQ